MRRLTLRNHPRPRRGFTLIELMIVIVIIGALLALLLPAVQSVLIRGRRTEVITEIKGLESAIANFKNVYGIEPPSRIRLYESGMGSPSWLTHPGTFVEPVTGATLTHDSERARSVAFFNQIWPNYDFTISHDFNGDGSISGYTSLTGAECLVFFLGGVGAAGTSGGTTAYTMTGFSKNPANPFLTATGNESREGPFFEFKQSRLRLSLNTANPAALVYFDPTPSQTAPYVYASSYSGRGYQRADLYVTASNSPADVYRAGPGGVTAVAQNAKSVQIISPGVDGQYGAGGYFTVGGTLNGLTNKKDYDNLTNFHRSTLSQ